MVDANLLFSSSPEEEEEELSTAQCLSQLLLLLTDDYIGRKKNLKRHIASLFCLLVTRENGR